MTLPAARKKSVVSEFLAKLADHSWLGGCARERRNWNGLYQDDHGARETVRARRSYGGGVGKTEQENGANGDGLG